VYWKSWPVGTGGWPICPAAHLHVSAPRAGLPTLIGGPPGQALAGGLGSRRAGFGRPESTVVLAEVEPRDARPRVAGRPARPDPRAGRRNTRGQQSATSTQAHLAVLGPTHSKRGACTDGPTLTHLRSHDARLRGLLGGSSSCWAEKSECGTQLRGCRVGVGGPRMRQNPQVVSLPAGPCPWRKLFCLGVDVQDESGSFPNTAAQRQPSKTHQRWESGSRSERASPSRQAVKRFREVLWRHGPPGAGREAAEVAQEAPGLLPQARATCAAGNRLRDAWARYAGGVRPPPPGRRDPAGKQAAQGPLQGRAGG